MKKWLKRIRGALGMGLTWAAAWFGVGVIFALVGVIGPIPIFDMRVLGVGALLALLGFLGGAAFSVVLGMVEGRRRFDQMSLPRFAAWGAVGTRVLGAGRFPRRGESQMPNPLPRAIVEKS